MCQETESQLKSIPLTGFEIAENARMLVIKGIVNALGLAIRFYRSIL
jgi:hypothetical protein